MSQIIKKIEGDPWRTLKIFRKNLNAEKKLKGDPLVSPGIVCYAEKGKTFFGSVTWANRYNLNICRTFGRTILVTSGISKKKHGRKAMTTVDSFLNKSAD